MTISKNTISPTTQHNLKGLWVPELNQFFHIPDTFSFSSIESQLQGILSQQQMQILRDMISEVQNTSQN